MEQNFTREDTLKFFGGDELATDVYLKKYAVTKPDGSIIEFLPTQMWERMAVAAASVEKNPSKWQEKFYEVLSGWRAVPQGSIMFALGNPYQKSSCSNCFTIPIKDDSLEAIFDTAKEMSRTYSYRGGVGIDISPLRPAGSLVSNAARTSTGAWSFMDFYSYVTRLIGQHGRRGALMITIEDRHPDLINFITSKTNKSKITGANISVKISDAFMKAVESDDKWVMEFKTKHELIHKEMPAREIWDLLVKTATETAEPGILFWDNILKESPADCYADVGFKTTCVNPCSELPLADYDACTLLSHNLTTYTRKDFTPDAYFDFDQLEQDIHISTRFLDNIKTIDLELMPLKRQREVAAKGRRIGMGTNGLADALANLRIKYDSDEAIEFVGKLYEFFAKTVYQTSVELGKEKGVFPIFDAKKEKGHPFLERIGFAGKARRNMACLTCAPTGSLSAICQTSSGIESVFRNLYTRRRKITHNEAINIPKSQLYKDEMGDLWQEYKVVHHNVSRYLALKGLESTPDVKLPKYFVESHQINWDKRIKLQSTMQKFIDHSISATVNLPVGTSPDEVKKIYEAAHRYGCKGCTVYVDQSRTGVLITNDAPAKIVKTNAPKRPKDMQCDVHHITVKGELYFVMVGMLNNEPYEVFAGKNGLFDSKVKTGVITKVKRGQYQATLDDETIIDNIGEHITDEQAAVTRLISLSLRHGADIKHCVSVLEKVPGDLQNFAKCIARTLKKYIPDNTKVTGFTCLSCGSDNIVRTLGCKQCLDCGWSACN